MPEVIPEFTLTCPHCGYAKTEIMPLEACLYYNECKACQTLLTRIEGDCCVFCSYGTVKCPPIHWAGSCCDRAWEQGCLSMKSQGEKGKFSGKARSSEIFPGLDRTETLEASMHWLPELLLHCLARTRTDNAGTHGFVQRHHVGGEIIARVCSQ